MKNFFNEFKKFISRGNVMDMAVGIIIGGAFTSIVTSLVNDIINPILGVFGGMNFDQLSVKLFGEATLYYGKFLTAVVNFPYHGTHRILHCKGYECGRREIWTQRGKRT